MKLPLKKSKLIQSTCSACVMWVRSKRWSNQFYLFWRVKVFSQVLRLWSLCICTKSFRFHSNLQSAYHLRYFIFPRFTKATQINRKLINIWPNLASKFGLTFQHFRMNYVMYWYALVPRQFLSVNLWKWNISRITFIQAYLSLYRWSSSSFVVASCDHKRKYETSTLLLKHHRTKMHIGFQYWKQGFTCASSSRFFI